MPITLYLESSPNPQSLKFVFNTMIVPEGMSLDFPDAESAKGSPLALELFAYPEIKRVFFLNNFITLTKAENIEWEEITGKIKPFLKEYIESKKPILAEDVIQDDSNENDSEIVKKIKGLLAEYVRPAVEQDGGAIQFHSYEDGIVKVLLQGSCSGCPSSTLTLKAGIENLFKRMIPEVQSVVAEGI
jgi:Fe-S cluster biogenesis protein NfuA